MRLLKTVTKLSGLEYKLIMSLYNDNDRYYIVLIIEQNEIHVATIKAHRNAIQIWNEFTNEI